MLRSIRSTVRLGDEGGVAIVEFALVLPLLLLLFLGMLDFGRAFNYWLTENHLANEAARWAIVGRSPDGQTGANALANAIKNQAGSTMGDVSSLAVTFCITDASGTAKPGDPITATVSRANYQWLGILGSGALFGLRLSPTGLTAKATMKLEAPYSASGASASPYTPTVSASC